MHRLSLVLASGFGIEVRLCWCTQSLRPQDVNLLRWQRSPLCNTKMERPSTLVLRSQAREAEEPGIFLISATGTITQNSARSSKSYISLCANNTPHANEVVVETSEQRLTVSGPSKGNTLWLAGVLANINVIGLELVDNGPEIHTISRRPQKIDTERGTHLLSRSKILTQLAVAAQSQ